MFYAAIQHCKGITPIKDHSHDVSEALEDIHDLINIIMHSHFIALDIKRYDEDIINYGLNDTEFDEAGALALIQPYHYLELPMIDRLWFVGRPFHQSDLPKYLKLAGDTERWIKKCRKGCNQVFRALSIQHLQMHGLDFDEDYLTEKNFDLSISFSHPIVEKLLSGELVTMDHLTNAYNKILEENKSNVITLK